MIELLGQSRAACLVVRFSGKVTGSENQQFLDALGDRLKAGNQINLVVEFEGFEFYGDFEAAKQDFKFGFGEYKHIHRAAFVGGLKWLEWLTRVIGSFTNAEEKHFSKDQSQVAFDWACD